MKNKFSLKYFFIIIPILLVFMNTTSPCYAADNSTATTPEPYTDKEFPQWAKDLRRTEIISFGSLPFVTLGVSIGYGGYLYYTGVLDSFPNPLKKSENSFDTDQQVTILQMSLAISLGIGITDSIINFIQRTSKNRRLRLIQESKEKLSIKPLTPEEAAEILKKNSEEQVIESSENQDVIENQDNTVLEE